MWAFNFPGQTKRFWHPPKDSEVDRVIRVLAFFRGQTVEDLMQEPDFKFPTLSAGIVGQDSTPPQNPQATSSPVSRSQPPAAMPVSEGIAMLTSLQSEVVALREQLRQLRELNHA